MSEYAALSDDFYVNLNLNTEMDLPNNRETILHYFEQVKKKYPAMQNFYCRERRDFVLEEEKDRGQYRWCSVEPRRVCSGYVNPPDIEAALEQHRLILDLCPFSLSVSPLDCEALDVLFGFDFTFRGNHHQLVAEALGVSPALERLMEIPGASVVNCEPALILALDEDCRSQVRVSIESRTSLFHMRTKEYPEDQISVYVTARQCGSLRPGQTFQDAMSTLVKSAQSVVDNYVIEGVLRPLARTIALK